MSSLKAARRYATSLIQVAIERKEVDTILEDITLIDNTLRDSRELVLFLKSPIIKRDKKKKVLDEIFGDEINELTQTFIDIMIRKGREDILPPVFKSFIDQYNDYAGIINISVVSADKMNDEQISELKKSLEEKTHKKVEMEISENKSLRGGLKVRIVDTVIDGTVQHKLEQLESLFLNTGM
ncbi:MAG TPA: ATP synthase F1 subunit delta [Balneolales bacterium]|nr:ATP synthase F1 subunit delta [Balneolales bacterium]